MESQEDGTRTNRNAIESEQRKGTEDEKTSAEAVKALSTHLRETTSTWHLKILTQRCIPARQLVSSNGRSRLDTTPPPPKLINKMKK